MSAFIFDLDGTLVDSVYQHVLAWHAALQECGFDLSVWRLHRRIGMSGGLLLRALARELDMQLDESMIARLRRIHAEVFARSVASIRVLPGAKELLAELKALHIPFIIATSGGVEDAEPMLKLLGPSVKDIQTITRADVKRAKPDPDVFLTAAKRLKAKESDVMVVGDSVWDMLAARRANFLGVGLLSGGYGQQELEQAGAFRVYADPAEMLKHLDELGVRPNED